ncbi:type III polyketide synthase [Bacillus dakarensis]|uniref:type III polyketide synthase n=1 Tax=Robertmurraya dakarensis TaxID=1926278 RepID=UPI000981E7EC|nr:3-oxoacyl-[acyl-carrier-protein] synthase III C-terminal domain-containing protein [Bacillus dakarensis]
MPAIVSVGEAIPPYKLEQNEIMEFSRSIFGESHKDIDRLLKVFGNGQIEKRHFVKNLDWYKKDRSFEEKNNAYIESAIEMGCSAIKNCLHNTVFLTKSIHYEEIDAIITISSSGIATPSIEARMMNILPFSENTKRIPIWGLGCAGGASGLSRAYEYCLAYPKAKVLVVAIEFCSLTFQKEDHSKSNIIGTSLFGDGAACALVTGDESVISDNNPKWSYPSIIGTGSKTWKNSLDVMGWDVRDNGLFVVFSKDIPTIVEQELKENVSNFLLRFSKKPADIHHFIAHPGGKKVLDAYVKSLDLSVEHIKIPLDVLRNFGNMSSVTIFFVLKRYMELGKSGELGLVTALGPGFSSELLLLRWE